MIHFTFTILACASFSASSQFPTFPGPVLVFYFALFGILTPHQGQKRVTIAHCYFRLLKVFPPLTIKSPPNFRVWPSDIFECHFCPQILEESIMLCLQWSRFGKADHFSGVFPCRVLGSSELSSLSTEAISFEKADSSGSSAPLPFICWSCTF